MPKYEINSKIPVYMCAEVFNNIRTIESRNWNRRLSPKNMSIVYELVDVWHRRIDSTIQMLCSQKTAKDIIPDGRGFCYCEISNNVGEIVYQYINDEYGNFALFIENIIFHLPWNLGTGRISINESRMNINKFTLVSESKLHSIIREAIIRILSTA